MSIIKYYGSTCIYTIFYDIIILLYIIIFIDSDTLTDIEATTTHGNNATDAKVTTTHGNNATDAKVTTTHGNNNNEKILGSTVSVASIIILLLVVIIAFVAHKCYKKRGGINAPLLHGNGKHIIVGIQNVW